MALEKCLQERRLPLSYLLGTAVTCLVFLFLVLNISSNTSGVYPDKVQELMSKDEKERVKTDSGIPGNSPDDPGRPNQQVKNEHDSMLNGKSSAEIGGDTKLVEPEGIQKQEDQSALITKDEKELVKADISKAENSPDDSSQPNQQVKNEHDSVLNGKSSAEIGGDAKLVEPEGIQKQEDQSALMTKDEKELAKADISKAENSPDDSSQPNQQVLQNEQSSMFNGTRPAEVGGDGKQAVLEGIQKQEDRSMASGKKNDLELKWKLCRWNQAADFIPCLDNAKAIKQLKSRRHMEHRERHCPTGKGLPRCLFPLPNGYKLPVHWPQSRDMIWFNNVPHPKLVEYKKFQNWVRVSNEYLVFPGGGTQFKAGAASYIDFIEKILPDIAWGTHTRVVLDVGCGVASFGGYLFDKGVLTMSFAPKDEHEAQIQLALERGIPAMLSVIGTQRLVFPSNVYDVIHCARCRVHWHGDGGKPLLEINRVLRPGGYFVWSATPVYRDNPADHGVWKAMVALTESICWTLVVKKIDSEGIGFAIYQKPASNSCYMQRKEHDPPLCPVDNSPDTAWYAPLQGCLHQVPTSNSVHGSSWPPAWPMRLEAEPSWLENTLRRHHTGQITDFHKDTSYWRHTIQNRYLHGLGIDWSTIRNVMDMKAGYGGFAAALIDQPVWVMNVIPVDEPDTLPAIFDRGLIGLYHDWCESFNTYPRTYDLLHADHLFGNLTLRCNLVDTILEMDRILRPQGWVIVRDASPIVQKLLPIMHSLHWHTNTNSTEEQEQFIVAQKGQWRPVS